MDGFSEPPCGLDEAHGEERYSGRMSLAQIVMARGNHELTSWSKHSVLNFQGSESLNAFHPVAGDQGVFVSSQSVIVSSVNF